MNYVLELLSYKEEDLKNCPFLFFNYKNLLYISTSALVCLSQVNPNAFLLIHIPPPLCYFPNFVHIFLLNDIDSLTFLKKSINFICFLMSPQCCYFWIWSGTLVSAIASHLKTASKALGVASHNSPQPNKSGDHSLQ